MQAVRNAIGAHMGNGSSGLGRGCPLNHEMRFATGQPLEGEPACWERWRAIAERCERHLKAAGIQALQQESHNED